MFCSLLLIFVQGSLSEQVHHTGVQGAFGVDEQPVSGEDQVEIATQDHETAAPGGLGVAATADQGARYLLHHPLWCRLQI
uniref:Secreted protein n=1 Tax=Paramormyrops kingsleyae TaxID=1676925 RepID=A0A3B3R6F3_9TELE